MPHGLSPETESRLEKIEAEMTTIKSQLPPDVFAPGYGPNLGGLNVEQLRLCKKWRKLYEEKEKITGHRRKTLI